MRILNSILLTILATILMQSCGNGKQPKNGLVPMSEESLIKANKGLVAIDKERIEAYAKRHNWDMQTTQTGLWHQTYEHGTGDSARTGSVAHINYSVSLLNGTLCYTSDSTGTKEFLIGQGGVESGLEEAITMMRVGDKAHFIMPPHLAHGLLGDGDKIPARATIVYNVELLNLTSN